MNIHKYERRYDLDWLRVFAFGLLIFYHSGLVFTNWIISNKEHSYLLSIIVYAMSQWRLPLLCVISGAGTCFALRKYARNRFVKDRVQRLLIPLIIGSVFINPPQLFFHELFVNENPGSYLAFQFNVFSFKIYPQGNLHWIHLWFIAYLLIYTLILVVLLYVFKKKKINYFASKIVTFSLDNPLTLVLLLVPLTILDILIGLFINPVGMMSISLFVYFLYGYMFLSKDETRAIARKYRFPTLIVALATTFLAVAIADITKLGDVYTDRNTEWFIVGKIIKNVNVFLWLATLIGFANQYLTSSSAFLKYASQAVYPFYVLHQSVLVVLAYYVIQLQASIASKFSIISLGTFGVSLAIYEFLINRNNILRVLFGLKTKKSTPASRPQQLPHHIEMNVLLSGEKVEQA